MLMHTPDVAARVANIGAYFLYETQLPPRLRALTWLIAARDLDCNYIWQSSLGAARAADVDDKLIAAIEADSMPGNLSTEDRLLFEYCYQLLRGNHHVSDSSYDAIIKQFGVPIAVQIAASVGYIAMLGVLVNAFNVAPPPDDSQPAL
jgi:4-carboxymuconolactone decarboxylase